MPDAHRDDYGDVVLEVLYRCQSVIVRGEFSSTDFLAETCYATNDEIPVHVIGLQQPSRLILPLPIRVAATFASRDLIRSASHKQNGPTS